MIREMIEDGTISEFRWIPTKMQIANALTKTGASTDAIKRVLAPNSCRYDHGSGTFEFCR